MPEVYAAPATLEELEVEELSVFYAGRDDKEEAYRIAVEAHELWVAEKMKVEKAVCVSVCVVWCVYHTILHAVPQVPTASLFTVEDADEKELACEELCRKQKEKGKLKATGAAGPSKKRKRLSKAVIEDSEDEGTMGPSEGPSKKQKHKSMEERGEFHGKDKCG
ncbi:hypothetical protein IW261DRAFT_1571134 [Armillaria novae-zelandiae]|uniref:Uncharacterized protein n=1 Tax=Armillaria novae-zelandiae TaxID=153914 RepID=A0AA39T8X0_9AGAR|nr:hypothetical protein IW261DRAFT_1571134 [Armillaria novae-zelandiae]